MRPRLWPNERHIHINTTSTPLPPPQAPGDVQCSCNCKCPLVGFKYSLVLAWNPYPIGCPDPACVCAGRWGGGACGGSALDSWLGCGGYLPIEEDWIITGVLLAFTARKNKVQPAPFVSLL